MIRLESIQSILLEGLQAPRPISSLPRPAEIFLRKLFEECTLEQLLGAREALDDAGMGTDDIAFLILSRVLDMCSRAKIDGIYKAPNSRKKAAIPNAAIHHVMEEVRCDLNLLVQVGRFDPGVLHSTSSEDMGQVEGGSVDAVITSPPYLNNFDFAEMTRMHLYFGHLWFLAGDN